MTAQASETFVLDGERRLLYAFPREDWFEFSGIPSPFKMQTTMLRRGYIGTWTIDEGCLFLIALKGSVPDASGRVSEPDYPARLDDEKDEALRKVFPGCSRVFAHWYSGTLRVPHGNMIRYGRGTFGCVFERELVIEVRGGLVTNMTEHRNADSAAETPAPSVTDHASRTGDA